MTKLTWDSPGNKLYETGIDRGVFYDFSGNVFPWNGLTRVVETEEDVVETVSFIDGNRYLNKLSSSNYSSNISAYTYPDILSEHTGELVDSFTNQEIKPFNLSYRTFIGNDIYNVDYGYKIHLIYNAKATVSNYDYNTLSNSVAPIEFTWNISTMPINIPNLKPTSHIIIDSSNTHPTTLSTIENILYGTTNTLPYFPSIEELFNIYAQNSFFMVVDHGDGSFSVTGEEPYVTVIDPTIFQLSSPTVTMLSSDTYEASTLTY